MHQETTLQLNVYNLTDELYYAQYYRATRCRPPAATLSVSLRARWYLRRDRRHPSDRRRMRAFFRACTFEIWLFSLQLRHRGRR